MAQTTGYLMDYRTNQKILVLVRGQVGKNATYRSFKLRKSGADGVHFEDEEAALNVDGQKYLDLLLNGEVVKL